MYFEDYGLLLNEVELKNNWITKGWSKDSRRCSLSIENDLGIEMQQLLESGASSEICQTWWLTTRRYGFHGSISELIQDEREII